MKSFAVVVAMLAAPPLSGPGDTIRSEAEECWTLPAGAEEGKARVILDVTIAAGGEVRSATVVETSDQGELGRAVGQSAVQAIQLCGPYEDVEPGTFKVHMGWKAVPDAPIDPIDPPN